LILALYGSWYHDPQRQQDAEQRLRNIQACSVWVVSNLMEAAMHKSLGIITGAFAILSAALLTCGNAQAGASASAPSKYNNNASHPVQTNRQGHFAITEYSSSSAKNPSQKH
jgi:hypothetical protein